MTLQSSAALLGTVALLGLMTVGCGGDCAPEVFFEEPADGAVFAAGDTVTFEVCASCLPSDPLGFELLIDGAQAASSTWETEGCSSVTVSFGDAGESTVTIRLVEGGEVISEDSVTIVLEG